MGSNAVGSNRVSATVGYEIEAGDFRVISPNLPQRIAILCEVNQSHQSDVDFDVPIEVDSAQVAGDLFGYGSPAYQLLRILKPITSEGVGGIPIIVYPQAAAGGSVAKVLTITPVGMATNNGTHYLVIAGRKNVDFDFYALNIVAGDTVADINQKIEDAINSVLGSPVTCASSDYTSVLTSKWKGKTSDGINVTVDTGGNDLGVTYTVVNTTLGNGTPSIGNALEAFGNEWNTIVLNSYGTVDAVLTSLEQANGVPKIGNNPPTGRFVGVIMKPFIALTGSIDEDPSAITDARLNNCTIAICPAPLSPGLAMEAAANQCLNFAGLEQESPHLDTYTMTYPDMPTPTDIGSMKVYDNRDAIVKKGCSTVMLNAGRYEMVDFVTTYHPIGEQVPSYRYCRNLMLDFNYRYGYYLLEQTHVVGKVIANDDDTVDASDVIKPKDWLQILSAYADDCTLRALIVQPDFTKASTVTGISSQNPDRLETTQKYKRSGIARIAATTVTAGFNYGTN